MRPDEYSELAMEEYLTTKELAKRIKMSQGTIRNLVWKGQFKENVHYVKPTSRKLLFVWSEVEAWLRKESSHKYEKTGKNSKCLINV